ncbi:MAG: hypothetical protein V1746_03755 [bacterium]
MIQVKVDDSRLQRSLAELAILTNKDVRDILKQEARLFCVALAKYTQPFGLDQTAKEKGETAVRRDIHKVYATAGWVWNEVGKTSRNAAKAVMKCIRNKQYAEAEKILKRFGIAIPVGELDAAFHKERFVQGKIKGRDKSQIVADEKKLEAYILKKLKLVGFAKSGWASCAKVLGGTRGIPAWARKNQAPSIVVDRSAQRNDPHFILINAIDYTSRVLSQSGMQGATDERVFKLLERIDKAAQVSARRLNFLLR